MNTTFVERAPLPIARAYRQMFERGGVEDAYDAIALFSEPLIKWYGAVALVVLRNESPAILTKSGVLQKFVAPSLGDWTRVIRMLLDSRTIAGVLEPFIAELEGRQPAELKAPMKAIGDYVGAPLASRTLIDFFEACVTYRNRTRGHGAPSAQHQSEFARVLHDAYEAVLPRLDQLGRLQVIFIERAEVIRSDAVHLLRACNGLNSAVLPERLSLRKSEALSSRSLFLFSENIRPLIELSPIVVRPGAEDRIYFLNSSRRGVEYLCYDRTGSEYYRPEDYRESVQAFFAIGGEVEDERRDRGDHRSLAPDRDAHEDLGFGGLGF